MAVIIPVCLARMARGAPERRHQTRMILSQEPAARRRLSWEMARSDISEDIPLKVCVRRPSSTRQHLTSRSSAPVKANLPVRSNMRQ